MDDGWKRYGRILHVMWFWNDYSKPELALYFPFIRFRIYFRIRSKIPMEAYDNQSFHEKLGLFHRLRYKFHAFEFKFLSDV